MIKQKFFCIDDRPDQIFDRQSAVFFACQIADSGFRFGFDRLTRKPMIETTLSLMRTPARLMGLSELQMFLERGFKAFRHMNGADEFLAIIGRRERRITEQLFAARSRPFDTGEQTDSRARKRAPICEETPVA